METSKEHADTLAANIEKLAHYKAGILFAHFMKDTETVEKLGGEISTVSDNVKIGLNNIIISLKREIKQETDRAIAQEIRGEFQ